MFYRADEGKEPVREWLKRLNRADRRAVGEAIAIVEFRWPVGMPVCRPLGKGLYEVRSNLGWGRIARVIFCVVGSRMVLLHAYIKKTRKMPKTDMDMALKRKGDVSP